MEKRGMSEARRRANKKWNDENLKLKYERLSIFVPMGRKEEIEARANELHKSLNAYTNTLYAADLGITDEEWKTRSCTDD